MLKSGLMTKKKKTSELEKMLSSLDSEEKELLELLDKKTFSLGKGKDAKLVRSVKKAVDNTLQKKKTISLRISEQDLRRLKLKAAEMGVGYNSIISILLKKYLNKM